MRKNIHMRFRDLLRVTAARGGISGVKYNDFRSPTFFGGRPVWARFTPILVLVGCFRIENPNRHATIFPMVPMTSNFDQISIPNEPKNTYFVFLRHLLTWGVRPKDLNLNTETSYRPLVVFHCHKVHQKIAIHGYGMP